MKTEERMEEHFDTAIELLNLNPRLEDLVRDVFRAGYLAGLRAGEGTISKEPYCGAI